MDLTGIAVSLARVNPKENYRLVVIKKEETLVAISEEDLGEELKQELENLSDKFRQAGFVIKPKLFKSSSKDRYVLLPSVYTGAELLAFNEKLKADKEALSALQNIPNLPQAVLETMVQELRRNPLFGNVLIIHASKERELYALITLRDENETKRERTSVYSQLADWLTQQLQTRDFVPWDELIAKSRSMGIATLATDDDLQNPSRLSNFKTALKRESGLRLRFRDGIVTKE